MFKCSCAQNKHGKSKDGLEVRWVNKMCELGVKLIRGTDLNK